MEKNIIAEQDLNIERNIRRIIELVWYDTDKYPRMVDLYRVTGLCERTVYRYAHRYHLPTRKAIRRNNLKSTFV